MVTLMLKDGTKFSDDIESINVTSNVHSNSTLESINVVFKRIITDEEKSVFSEENCETVTIVDYQGNEQVYTGYNKTIMIGNQFNDTSTRITVILTKTNN